MTWHRVSIWLEVVSTTPCHFHRSDLLSQILYFHYALTVFHSAPSSFSTLSTSISCYPAPLPLLFDVTFPIQATRPRSFQKGEGGKVWPSQDESLGWQNLSIDGPWFLDYLGGEQEQVSESSKGAPEACFLPLFSSSPFGLGLGWGGRASGKLVAVVCFLPAWKYPGKKVNVLVTLAFPFQFEYIKIQPSSCANPQAIEIKGF